MRCLYNPKMYGESTLGGPSSFYIAVNALDIIQRGKVVTVSRTVGCSFGAMPAVFRMTGLACVTYDKRGEIGFITTSSSLLLSPTSHSHIF